MTDQSPEDRASAGPFMFLKGTDDVFAKRVPTGLSWEQAAAIVREHFSDALTGRHISFLLGSGCSSFVKDGKQLGIPTMAPIAAEFSREVGDSDRVEFVNAAERKMLVDWFGVDITESSYQRNLEYLSEVLLCLQFVLRRTSNEKLAKEALPIVESVIKKITRFVLAKCSTGAFAGGDDTVVRLYQAFYKKLSFRDRGLPRPWVFTTNYDLFNEIAMDRLSIPYANGFSGTVERRFNPANFRYSLGEQLDITSRKWTAAESFVYLCKLHGSINWIEEQKGLFPIRELQSLPLEADRLMIFPTPAKQAASFGAPYADLFREFQSRIVREQSVLCVLGYSFGDQHVNNIIFQALTIPSFRLVAFVPPDSEGVVATLMELGDPRIWIVGGNGCSDQSKAHYFDTFVDHFMPEMPGDKVDRAVLRVLDTLLAGAAKQEREGEDGL